MSGHVDRLGSFQAKWAIPSDQHVLATLSDFFGNSGVIIKANAEVVEVSSFFGKVQRSIAIVLLF